jgi:hypothetical protein
MPDLTAVALPVLENLCPECRGAGGRREGGEWFRCYDCQGAGHVPTAAGEQVLALMRHNFGPLHEKAHKD